MCTDSGLKSVDYNIDSQVLFAILAKEGNADVFTRALGSIAVIFTDTNKQGLLYVFRNSERPLFRGKSDEGMYICSEDNALKIIGCADIKEFKEHTFYTIVDGQIRATAKLKKPIPPPPVVPFYQNFNKNRNSRGRSRHLENLPFFKMNLKDRWILCDISTQNYRPANGEINAVTRWGEWYYCTDHHEFIVHIKEDEEARAAKMYRSNIRTMDYTVKKKDFLIAMQDVQYKDTSMGNFAEHGDLLVAKSDENDKNEVSCYNIMNGHSCSVIYPTMYRIAKSKEIEEKLDRVKNNMTIVKTEEDGELYAEMLTFFEGFSKVIEDMEFQFCDPTSTKKEIEDEFVKLKSLFEAAKSNLINLENVPND